MKTIQHVSTCILTWFWWKNLSCFW